MHVCVLLLEKLVKQAQMWETFQWHYRPWKAIVDGKFLPKNSKDGAAPVAFLPEHPHTLLKTGEFNKVFFY